MRWRNVGLQAIKSVASSEALVQGRQLELIVPILLENLWTDNGDFLDTLEHRTKLQAKEDTEKMLRRRNSVATVRTIDTVNEGNPLALSGTTADADKLAEEDIGVLALQCLQQIFVVNNRQVGIIVVMNSTNSCTRTQILNATEATLKFISDRVMENEQVCFCYFCGFTFLGNELTLSDWTFR